MDEWVAGGRRRGRLVGGEQKASFGAPSNAAVEWSGVGGAASPVLLVE